MIDLSCHFLYGPACGPRSFAESLELCRTAIKQGVDTIVFTPRWNGGSDDPSLLTQCRQDMEHLRNQLQQVVDLQIGFLLQFSAELAGLVDRYGENLALGGKRHLLVSMPANKVPMTADNIWRELWQRGFRVVISQPESRPALRRQPETLRAWVVNGIKLQISAASILGWHGREVRRFALEYLQQYKESVFIASNGHAGNGDAGALKQAREEITRIFGDEYAGHCLRDLPAAILAKNIGRAPSRTPRPFTDRRSFLRALSSWSGAFSSTVRSAWVSHFGAQFNE